MIELQLIIGLSRTINTLNRNTAALGAQHHLTLSQFGVLEALYHKGDLTIGQVKELILSTDGTIPVVVKNLEKNGLIARYPHPTDKRCTLLKLLPEGRGIIEELFPKNVAMIQEQMKVWSDEEKELLLHLLKRFGGKDRSEGIR